MDFAGLNHLGVAAATVAGFAFGAAWYGVLVIQGAVIGLLGVG